MTSTLTKARDQRTKQGQYKALETTPRTWSRFIKLRNETGQIFFFLNKEYKTTNKTFGPMNDGILKIAALFIVSSLKAILEK